jgi:hypothetical protein
MTGLFSSLWGRLTTRRDTQAHACSRSADDVIAEFEAGQAIPDDLVDAFLDGEVAPERQGALFSALRREPEAHVRLDETERIIDAMRDSERVPDLTGKILGEVHRRRTLLDCAGLRRVSLARWSMAACLIMGVTVFFIVRRSAPEATSLTPVSAPINDLVRALPGETSGAIIAARSALNSVRQIGPEPVEIQACSSAGKTQCGEPCRVSCLMVVSAPVVDSRLLLSSWLESIEDIAAFAETSAPAETGRVRTVQAAWSPAPARSATEAPVISVRSLLLEPGRMAQTEEADRLLPTPRR